VTLAIAKYEVVSDTSLSAFNRQSQVLVNKGYRPKGGLKVLERDGWIQYSQAFVKQGF
jgi:hypothetical protein